MGSSLLFISLVCILDEVLLSFSCSFGSLSDRSLDSCNQLWPGIEHAESSIESKCGDAQADLVGNGQATKVERPHA
jgi:hypothetical protein